MQQLRIPRGGENRLYNPDRDLAHNFRYVMLSVAQQVQAMQWIPALGYVKAQKLTPEQLGDALTALVRFVRSATEQPQDTYDACLERCGWTICRPEAQLLILAYLGSVMMPAYYMGAREVAGVRSLDDQEPGMEAEKLLVVIQPILQAIYQPSLWTQLCRQWRYFKAALCRKIFFLSAPKPPAPPEEPQPTSVAAE